MKKYAIFFSSVLLAFVFSAVAFANGSPSTVKIKMYGVAVSQNTDCSNPTLVNYDSTGTTYDVTTNPAIFSGNVAVGTYPCVILLMDDEITFAPSTNVGTNCVAGQTYSRVLCVNSNSCKYTSYTVSNGSITLGNSVTSAASSSTDTGNVQQVALFLSTGSTGTGMAAFVQPTASSDGIALNGAFTVSASGKSGTFVVNFNNQVKDTGTDCDLDPPTFGFR